MSILVVNAGSSSVKFGLFEYETLIPTARALLDWAGSDGAATLTITPHGGEPIVRRIDAPDYRTAVVGALALLDGPKAVVSSDRPIRAIGHRLIHGGEEIREAVRIDTAIKRAIVRYEHLAPLHIPPGLEAIAATEEALPEVDQVGLFDTAFFGRIPPEAYLYPVPYAWYEEWGIRRFGFHGISHAYCAGRTAEMLEGIHAASRLILCHLGQGSSATAIRDGVAVTNTMGFTPLEGFPMGTRSGTLDPGILLYVQREHGLSLEQLDTILNKESGLLGISGVSSDFRKVEEAAAAGHERARLAMDVHAYRVRALIGSLAVTLGGVDALVFTGGIGENSASLRSEVCRGLECLGIELDADANNEQRPDCDVATANSLARILLIHTREDLMIAREARRLTGGV